MYGDDMNPIENDINDFIDYLNLERRLSRNTYLSYKNDLAPYVGIGFSPAITNRWGVFGEIGAYYNGNPSVNLNANPAALGLVGDDGRTLGQALAAEEREIGGLGIFITKKTMDQVNYAYENGENILTMMKKI